MFNSETQKSYVELLSNWSIICFATLPHPSKLTSFSRRQIRLSSVMCTSLASVDFSELNSNGKIFKSQKCFICSREAPDKALAKAQLAS